MVDEDFLDDLCDFVTEGIKRDVGGIPRQFLLELITVQNLVEEHDGSDGGKEYIPRDVYHFPWTGYLRRSRALWMGKRFVMLMIMG